VLPLEGYLNGASASEWWVIWGAIGLFAPLFWWIFHLSRARSAIPLAAMTVLGAVFTPLNPHACLFFAYAGGTVGFLGRPSWSLAALAIIAAAIGIETLVFDLSVGFWASTTLFTVIFGGYCIHWSETNKTNEQLRRKQSEIERLAKIAERERIARDLHDLLGHTLSVSVLKARLAAKLIRRDPDAAQQEVEEIERISRGALEQVREAVQGYRSAGFIEELENARLALDTAGITSHFKIEDDAAKAPSQIAHTLAMALREAITNVIRHARCTRCEVELANADGAVVLKVDDDGIGGTFVEGAGLSGMRERVESLGGSMQLEGISGASIRVRLPIIAGPKEHHRPLRPRRGVAHVIRVLIAEDQGMLLSTLGTLLDLEDDLEVVALAKDGREALELARTTTPDIVLTDIEMPELTGIELAQHIRDEQLAIRVIMVTTFARAGYLRRALDAGARGYLLKDSPGDVLPNAIRTVHAGGAPSTRPLPRRRGANPTRSPIANGRC